MKLKLLDPLGTQLDLEMEPDRVANELNELSGAAPAIPEKNSKSPLTLEKPKEDSLQSTSRRLEEFLQFAPKKNPHLAPHSKLARALKAYKKFAQAKLDEDIDKELQLLSKKTG